MERNNAWVIQQWLNVDKGYEDIWSRATREPSQHRVALLRGENPRTEESTGLSPAPLDIRTIQLPIKPDGRVELFHQLVCGAVKATAPRFVRYLSHRALSFWIGCYRGLGSSIISSCPVIQWCS